MTTTTALPVWKKRLDAKTLVTTPNSDAIYAMSYLDLGKDGPMVFEAPPGLQGILVDFAPEVSARKASAATKKEASSRAARSRAPRRGSSPCALRLALPTPSGPRGSTYRYASNPVIGAIASLPGKTPAVSALSSTRR
jgi:hypothetical protein